MGDFSKLCDELGFQAPIVKSNAWWIDIDIHKNTIENKAEEVLRKCKDLAKDPKDTLCIYAQLLEKVHRDKTNETNKIGSRIDDFYNRLLLDIALDYITSPQQYGLFKENIFIQLINPNFLQNNG